MTNDRTPGLQLALPHPQNQLQDDVLRLREALQAVDGACTSLSMLLDTRVTDTELAAALGTLQGSLTNLSTTVAFLTNTKVGVVNGQQGPNVTLTPAHLGLGPANGPSLQSITRDAQGRIATLSATVGGKVAQKTLTYDAEGRLATVVTAYDGRTRTETLNYAAGALTGLTAVEVATP